MGDKVGRNDPCPCGSGKKYKNCCFQLEQKKRHPLGGRKFTAKVLSAGGVNKPKPQSEEQTIQPVDYTTLMERAFGDALHSHEEAPPSLVNPSEFLDDNQEQKT